MKKMVFAMTLLVGLNSFAGGTVGSAQEPLAHIKVCPKPQDAQLQKSMEITLTEDQIQFDIENGPARIEMHMGERATLKYQVKSIEREGLLKRGFKVDFDVPSSTNPNGVVGKTFMIYKDSVEIEGTVTYAADCKN